ncbi:MAG: hypothetical protein ACOCWM_00050 [Cyclobacteriaceae bacterium]
MKKSIEKKTAEIEQLRDEIKDTLQVKAGKNQQEKIFEAITLAGAVAFVLYALLRMLFGKKKHKKKKSDWNSTFSSASKKETGLGKMIKDQFFIILISIVSEQLQKYLKKSNISSNGKSNLHENSKKEK